MSLAPQQKPVTVQTLLKKKRMGEKIVTLTAYDYSTARILDAAGVDLMLVGDSLAMTILGHPNTLSVTVDEMLHHVKAVVRGAQTAMIVADMPFMSYQAGHDKAIENAGRFIKEGGATAVKLEGATPQTISIIEQLVQIGVPVMGHLGFTPQSVNTMGGYKVQGKSIADARKLINEARWLQDAGVFALVLEMVPVEVAQLVSQQLEIPTIGIGAGNVCDGQILVVDDVLGRYADLSPRFVRRYMHLDEDVRKAVERYAEDVKSGDFPSNESEAFHFPEDQLKELLREQPSVRPLFFNKPGETKSSEVFLDPSNY